MRTHTVATATLVSVAVLLPSVSAAWAEEQLAPQPQKITAAEPEAHLGVGLRFRGVFVPKGVLEFFWDEVSSGTADIGFGIDFIRIKEDFELRIGVEWDRVQPDDGIWLERGDDGVTPGERPDVVDFDGLSWLTLDASFIFHLPLHEVIALRYGAGLGLGIVLGDAVKTDAVCTGTDDFQTQCMEDPNPEEFREDFGIPPVFPVINVIAGVQYRPTETITINVEGGIRTVLFVGLSAGYLFD